MKPEEVSPLCQVFLCADARLPAWHNGRRGDGGRRRRRRVRKFIEEDRGVVVCVCVCVCVGDVLAASDAMLRKEGRGREGRRFISSNLATSTPKTEKEEQQQKIPKREGERRFPGGRSNKP